MARYIVWRDAVWLSAEDWNSYCEELPNKDKSGAVCVTVEYDHWDAIRLAEDNKLWNPIELNTQPKQHKPQTTHYPDAW